MGIPFSAGDFGAGAKGHNCELRRMIFSYKHAWMAWVGVMENMIIMYLSIVLDIVLEGIHSKLLYIFINFY